MVDVPNVFVFDEILIGSAALAAISTLKKRGNRVRSLEGKHAIRHLDRAIEIHHRHLTGKESTSDVSQNRMMVEMIEARYALAKQIEEYKKATRDRLLNPF